MEEGSELVSVDIHRCALARPLTPTDDAAFTQSPQLFFHYRLFDHKQHDNR